jgi:hypothetical protein
MAFNSDGIKIIGDPAKVVGKTFKHLARGAPIEITAENNVRFQVTGVLDLAPVDVEVPMAFFYGIVGPYLTEIAKAQGVHLNMQGG